MTPNIRVHFGRNSGEKTLGVIIKYNPTKAKVRILEARGIDARSPVGSVWNVPYNMIMTEKGEKVNQYGVVPHTTVVAPGVVVVDSGRGGDGDGQQKGPMRGLFGYKAPEGEPMLDIANPALFSNAERHIVMAVAAVFTDLSPENLTHDGEAPAHMVKVRRAELHRQLDGLFKALGRSITEEEAYDAAQYFERVNPTVGNAVLDGRL